MAIFTSATGIVSASLNNSFLLQILLYAGRGAVGGFALGMAENSRRRIARMAVAGAAGMCAGWLTYYFLNELVYGIIPLDQVRTWLGGIIIGGFWESALDG